MIIIAVPKLEVKKHYSLNSYSWLFFFWSSAFFLKYKTENQWNIEFITLDKISLQISLNLLLPLCKLVMGFLSSWWLWLSSRRIRLEESEAFCGSAALNTQALFSYPCVAPSPLSSFCDLPSPLWVHQALSLGKCLPSQSWSLDKGEKSPWVYEGNFQLGEGKKKPSAVTL